MSNFRYSQKNEYFLINEKRTFAKVIFTCDLIVCEVFIPKKGTELHTFHGRWDELIRVQDVRSSNDNRKWIVTVLMSYAAIIAPTVWDFTLKGYYSELSSGLNKLIKY